MEYYFDYGFMKEGKWLDGIHRQEHYSDGKRAFERYCEIQRKGRKNEQKLKEQKLIPEGNDFTCTLDILHEGKPNLNAAFSFFIDAFNKLSAEQKRKADN